MITLSCKNGSLSGIKIELLICHQDICSSSQVICSNAQIIPCNFCVCKICLIFEFIKMQILDYIDLVLIEGMKMRNTQTQKEGMENSDAKNRKKIVSKPFTLQLTILPTDITIVIIISRHHYHSHQGSSPSFCHYRHHFSITHTLVMTTLTAWFLLLYYLWRPIMDKN